MIDRQEFLDVIFGDIEDDEHVCVSRATPKKVGDDLWWTNYLEDARQWRKWSPENTAQAWYYNVCTVTGELNEKQTMVSRGRANLMRYYVLVLDDIGQKTDAPPVAPTYKLESSVESFQWGYALVPGSDVARFEALIEAIHQKGWGDAGAGGSYRVMRVPGSANIKPGRQGFRSRIVEWSPDRYWTLDELAEAFGVDMNAVEVKPVNTMNTKTGGAVAMDGIDPMLDWLVDGGYVVIDKGEWVDVICPWADSHTSGSNTAGYSPLGRGSGDWVQTRAFKCLHEHCASRDLSAFVKWGEELGGPYVSGYDPLPWLQERYAYVGMDMKVADMHQRLRGGPIDNWLWDLPAWTKRHPGKVAVPGETNKIKVADAFVASTKTRHVDYTYYEPVSRAEDVGVVHVKGQPALNTYTPPNWEPVDGEPSMFLEHMEYVIPDVEEREIFLNWLAVKFQHPKSRAFSIVMVADGVFGTGRSWLRSILSLALQGKVKTATLAQLIGQGTSAEQNYNDWMAGCQFLVVEEAKETIDRDAFWHGYDVFKQNVDTRVGSVRINPKYGRTREENIYFNALIFTNHRDALALPDNDRRVCVVMNATEMNTPEYYERLEAATNDREAARLYWYLMRREIPGDYDRIYPADTRGKDDMIENNRAPSDVLLDYFRDIHWSDLVTKRGLRDLVQAGAAKFDMDAIATKPGGVTNVIWSELGTLKDVKNGLRVTVLGEQEQVRALRNKKNWRAIVADGDLGAVKLELEKTKNAAVAAV